MTNDKHGIVANSAMASRDNPIYRLLRIDEGEGRWAALVAALFAVLEAGRSLSLNAADALLFHRFGVNALPFLFVALGVISAVAILAYAASLSHFEPRSLYRALFLLAGLVFGIERASFALNLPYLYPVFWLCVNVLNALLGTIMWGIAVDACNTQQADRLFSLFASAGILGSILGNLLTGTLDHIVGTENLIVVYIGLLLTGMVLTSAIYQHHDPRSFQQTRGTVKADMGAGFNVMRGSRLLQLVAFSSILTTLLYFSFSFPFNTVVAASFVTEGDVATFLGTFSAIVTAATFLVSLFIANRLYRRIGVGNTALILPLTYLVGFALFAIHSSLTVAMIARLAQMTVHVGLGVSAFKLFFNAVPAHQRKQVLSFNDAVPKQIGVVLSGALLILTQGAMGVHLLMVMGMSLAVLCAYLLWQARTAYHTALAWA